MERKVVFKGRIEEYLEMVACFDACYKLLLEHLECQCLWYEIAQGQLEMLRIMHLNSFTENSSQEEVVRRGNNSGLYFAIDPSLN